jgi:ABC-type uncharacterized transport system ATPase subunit
VRVAGRLPNMAGVEAVTHANGALKLALAPEASPQVILQQLVSKAEVEQFEVAVPTLDEIFIRTVSDRHAS